MYTYSKYSKDDEKDDLKEVPVTLIGHLEQYQFAGSEWVHGLCGYVLM